MFGLNRHWLFGAAISGLLLALGGCTAQNRQAMNPDNWVMKNGWTPGFEQRVNARLRPSQGQFDVRMIDPLPDEAAGLRDWNASIYHYSNGGVVAYPTYAINYEDRPSWLSNDYLYSAVSPVLLVADAICLPVLALIEPPTTEVTYHGPRFGPSMTVAPPLQR